MATKEEKATEEGNSEKKVIVKQCIEKTIYHLYGLSYDEVLIVDPDTPITREEYEKDSHQELTKNKQLNLN